MDKFLGIRDIRKFVVGKRLQGNREEFIYLFRTEAFVIYLISIFLSIPKRKK